MIVPKITIIADSHQLSEYQRCPSLYEKSQVQQFGTEKMKTAFIKGRAIHDVLETYYLCKIQKKPIDQCVMEALLKLQTQKELSKDEFRIISPKLIQYFAHYRDETWVPLKTEIGFSKLLYEDSNHLFVYEGKIDLLLEVQRAKAFSDHKSQSRHQNLPQDSNQFLGYAWATGLMLGIINFLNLAESKAPKDAFRREICNYTPNLIKEWTEGAIDTMLRMARSQREGRYLKQRHGCLGVYGLCDFIDVCKQTSKLVQIGMLKRDFIIKEPWSPWEI